uniref:LRR receptor-like serine/threonine-protein kinase n=1 Tax=Vitis vinifera TaxID=29760 RepID=F6GXC7_VITVI
MRALKMLQIIDLSWNIISGNIPTILGGFQSLYSLNLYGTDKSKIKFLVKVILPAIASVLILVALVLMMVKYQKRNMETQRTVLVLRAVEHRMISYQELHHATNDFSEANILGVGSFVPSSKEHFLMGPLLLLKL